MASNERQLPAYLTNLNSDSEDVLLQGKKYLQGLPLQRSTNNKRKRPSVDEIISQRSTSSSLLRTFRINHNLLQQLGFDGGNLRGNSIIISVVIIIISSTIIILFGFIFKTRRFSKEFANTSKRSTPIKKKRKRKKRKKKPKTNPMNHGENCKHRESNESKKNYSDGRVLTEVAIITPCQSEEELSAYQESQDISTLSTHDLPSMNNSRETTTETISRNKHVDTIHNLNSQTIFPINEITMRWESLGLSKQKSLEIAANAELNFYFYQDLKQFLSSFFDQLNWHSLKLFKQSESHHREQMNASAVKELLKCREEIKFALLNTQMLCRCLVLALLVRFIRRDNNLASVSNSAFNTLLSNLCPDWNTPFSQETISNFTYYDLVSWRNVAYNLMESLSSAWYNVGRMMFYIFCLGLLHCVSKKLTYSIIVSSLIPWREILMTGFVLVATNCLLTFNMLQKCSNFDLGSENAAAARDTAKTNARQMADQYNRQMNCYRAMSYCLSICIGMFDINSSLGQIRRT